MAGGTWKAQNKVRAGAYINFKAVPSNSLSLGSRGVMTMPVALSWGPQKGVIELFSTDLNNGASLSKIGLTATDSASLIFRLALANAYKAYIYRLDVGGTKATNTHSNLTAVAKYQGTFGNNITIVVEENANDNTKWDIITVVSGSEKDRQIIDKTALPSTLESNDWVDFSGSTAIATATAGITLTGGTNGAVAATQYTATDGYLNAVAGLNWNTMAIPQDSTIVTSTVQDAVKNYITDLRENQGVKVQAVLNNVSYNYEGIISTKQGFNTLDEQVTPDMFTAFVAGLTAGADVNESNTYKVIENAVSIVYPTGVTPYSNETIISLIQAGQFILSTRQDGAIVVEQDINTLHSPYPNTDVNYAFSKNRVIRTLDEINNTISSKFQTSYIGKVNNDADGRNIFKSDIISYMNTLQNIGAIQEFDGATDIDVVAGDAIDAVVVNLAVKPVDSMEKLYMTVSVG